MAMDRSLVVVAAVRIRMGGATSADLVQPGPQRGGVPAGFLGRWAQAGLAALFPALGPSLEASSLQSITGASFAGFDHRQRPSRNDYCNTECTNAQFAVRGQPTRRARTADSPCADTRLAVRGRPTHRVRTPDSPCGDARLAVREPPTRRARTPDSPCADPRLAVRGSPTRRARTPDSPCGDARTRRARTPDSPCGDARLTVRGQATHPASVDRTARRHPRSGAPDISPESHRVGAAQHLDVADEAARRRQVGEEREQRRPEGQRGLAGAQVRP